VSQLAVIAARMALRDAGLEPGQLAAPGLVLGSYWGDLRSSEAFASGFLARGPLGLSPLVFPSTVMNAMAAHVAIALGVRGPMLTVNDLGAAGDLAVAQGVGLLRARRATAVLAGGVDEICPIVYRELARLGALSTAPPGPEGCRPFDRRGNGTVLGEGATLLLLETAEAAAARGARVYAELAGAAWGSLPHRARPRREPGRGGTATVTRALAEAGLPASAIDLAYLTGAGEPRQDACELELVGRSLGQGPGPRATALTPLTGDHAGLGALRVGAAALAVSGGPVPALPDLAEPVATRLALVTAPAVPRPGGASPVALVHGLGREGTQVALVVRATRTDAAGRAA
jgi:3-oxoacyl-[acyl-carrier-protein] synthase II